jgi:hypothetical protein
LGETFRFARFQKRDAAAGERVRLDKIDHRDVLAASLMRPAG